MWIVQRNVFQLIDQKCLFTAVDLYKQFPKDCICCSNTAQAQLVGSIPETCYSRIYGSYLFADYVVVGATACCNVCLQCYSVLIHTVQHFSIVHTVYVCVLLYLKDAYWMSCYLMANCLKKLSESTIYRIVHRLTKLLFNVTYCNCPCMKIFKGTEICNVFLTKWYRWGRWVVSWKWVIVEESVLECY